VSFFISCQDIFLNVILNFNITFSASLQVVWRYQIELKPVKSCILVHCIQYDKLFLICSSVAFCVYILRCRKQNFLNSFQISVSRRATHSEDLVFWHYVTPVEYDSSVWCFCWCGLELVDVVDCRELLGQRPENIRRLMLQTVANELSPTRSPNNMMLLTVVFQQSPDLAAKVLPLLRHFSAHCLVMSTDYWMRQLLLCTDSQTFFYWFLSNYA